MSATPTTAVQKQLADAIEQAKRSFHRLVLVVGPSGTGKTEFLRQLAESERSPYLNVNLHLSQRMLELPRSRRPRQVDRIVNALAEGNRADLLILDNLEILFDPSLQVDPLRLLKAVSRKQTIVAAWNGTLQDGALTYAEPDHPEYRSYRDVDVLVVSVPTGTTPSH
jgi:type II secretory pathway predicted ATPase ExeA